MLLYRVLFIMLYIYIYIYNITNNALYNSILFWIWWSCTASEMRRGFGFAGLIFMTVSVLVLPFVHNQDLVFWVEATTTHHLCPDKFRKLKSKVYINLYEKVQRQTLPRLRWPDRSDPWSDEFRAHTCSRCARITWSGKGLERTFVWNLPDQRPLCSGTVGSEAVSSAH